MTKPNFEVKTISVKNAVTIAKVQTIQVEYGFASATQALAEIVNTMLRFFELCDLYEKDKKGMNTHDFGKNCRVLFGMMRANKSPEHRRVQAQFCRDETAGKKPK